MSRKKANIHYIYKTICIVTERWYIGMHSTSNIDDGYMGSGTILRRSIRKYGVENHTKEILEYLDTRELLVLREREIVTKELISDGLCMNLKEGGQGGFSSEEHQLKCSKAGGNAFIDKLNNDEEFRKKHNNNSSNNLKKAQSEGKMKNGGGEFWKDKNHTDETKQLISEKKKGTGIGENNSQFGTCWITKDGINKKIKKEDFDKWINKGWVKGRK